MGKYNYFEYEGNISENKFSVKEKIDSYKNKLLAVKRENNNSGSASGSTMPLPHISGEKIHSAISTIVEKSESTELTAAKKAKMVICFMLAVIIAATGFVSISIFSINHKNKVLEDYKSNAKNVCVDYVTQYGNANAEGLYNDYKMSGCRLTGLCFVREVDFDDDGDSELMLCYYNNTNYMIEIWGYNDNNEFEALYSGKSAKTGKKGENCWTALYYKNKKYWLASHDENDSTKVKLLKFKNKKFEEDFNCTYNAKEHKYSTGDENDDSSFELIQLSKMEEKDALRAVDRAAKALEAITGSATIIVDPNAEKSLEDAYYSIIKDYNKEYGQAEYVEKDNTAYINGLAIVDLVDFNGDGQNELLLVYRKKIVKRDEDEEGNLVSRASYDFCLEVFKYDKEKKRAVNVYKNEGISNNSDDKKERYYILKQKGKRIDYCINTSVSYNYGKQSAASSTALKFNGKEFKTYSRLSKEKEYGYSQYYVDGEESYKSRFEEKSSGIPYFNGNTKYDNNKYTVEFVQRKKLKAGDMKNRVDKTIDTIKILNPKYSPAE